MPRLSWDRVKRIGPRIRNLLAPGAVVLLYHRINRLPSDPHRLAVSPEHFEEHLDVIRRLGHPRSLRDLTVDIKRGRSVRRGVAVTFDDGYADNVEYAIPLLERFDVPATLFAVSGYVGAGREFAWDQAARDASTPDAPSPPSNRTVTADELSAVARLPLMEVGAHTVSHPRLSALPASAQAVEVAESRRQIEQIVGRSVTSFAYPFGGPGDYTRETVAAVRAAGFERACSNFFEPVDGSTDPFQVPRLTVPDCDGEELLRSLRYLAFG